MQQRLIRSVFPNYNELFFNHFNEAAEIACEMANLLFEAVNSSEEQPAQYTNINRLRAKSQEITHQVYTDSGKAFISPFERSDMFELVKSIDSVSSSINIASRRINLYQLPAITTPVKDLAKLVVDISCELAKCVRAMSNLRDNDTISHSIDSIKALEHYADKVYNEAVADLLAGQPDAIELIKYNEILLALETTTDKCEQVTNVIEGIVVKNS